MIAAVAMVLAIQVPTAALAVPVPIAGKAAIFGVVTPDAGGTFAGTITAEVSWRGTDGSTSSWSDIADSSGYFEMNNVTSSGTYVLTFRYAGTAGWATTGWAPPASVEGASFTLAPNQVLEANGPLHLAGGISGTVSVPVGASLWGLDVAVFNSAGSQVAYARPAPGVGTYSITGLAAGQYRVRFADANPLLRNSWFEGAGQLSTATPITVTFGQVTSNIDVALTAINAITGTVTYELEGGGTAPLANATVIMGRHQDHASFSTATDSLGRYVLPNAAFNTPFDIYFQAPPGSHLANEFYDDAPDYYDGVDPLTVDPSSFLYGIDATLAREATISGRVMFDITTPSPLSGAFVSLYRYSETLTAYKPSRYVATDADGQFTLEGLPAGSYVLKVVDGTSMNLGGEYWDDARFLSEATPIVLTAGQSEVLSDIVLTERDIETKRLAGADRFATGVAISKTLFPGDHPDVPVVYIANGTNYPDALTAGPAAIQKGGGLLLVWPDSIPAAVAQELERLQPEKIIVVGDNSAVSSAVQHQLEEYVPDPTDVSRIGGADRFQTAEAIIREAFPPNITRTAFFATGLNYPDALAAGPAAGVQNAPIFLVNGSGSELPEHTIDLMKDLGVSTANIVGSPSVVSEHMLGAILDELTPYGPFDATGYSRLGGADRYQTSVEVSRGQWTEADYAFLATGSGFADALAGGPLAGKLGVPLFLSAQSCVPQSVVGELVRLNVNLVYILGGEGTLSTNVADLVPC